MSNNHVIPSDQLTIVKSTAPAIQANSLEIAARLYERLFENHPETQAFFANTSPGQAQRLADALVSYTENIDDLTPIEPVVKAIARRHVRAGVLPEHYDIVGTELLGSVVDVLGDLSTEVLDAWAAAYQVLADLFIDIERKLMQDVSTPAAEGPDNTPEAD